MNLNGIYHPSQALFFNDYATYIDNLVPQNATTPTPTQQAKIKMIKDSLTTAQTTLNNDFASASSAWTQQNTYFPGKYPTFQSFLNQTIWGATINTDQNNVAGFNSQLSTLYSSIYGDDYVAIQQNKATVDGVRSAMVGSTVTSPADMAVAAESGTLIVPTYNPSSLSTFSSWVDSTISAHGSARPISIAFSARSGHFDFSQSTYFSHTNWNVDLFFFSLSGSSTTSRQQVNIDTDSSSFGLEIQFDAITEVQLSRGPWYDSSLMYDFQNNGSLATPTILYVGMYPKIILKMDQSSYNSAYSAYTSSSGFGVGCFWGSAGTQTDKSTAQMVANWDSSTQSVTIESQSIQPVIVGMEVAQLNDV